LLAGIYSDADVGEAQSTKFDYADPAGVSAHVFSRFLDPDSAASWLHPAIEIVARREKARNVLQWGENATTRVKSRVYEIVTTLASPFPPLFFSSFFLRGLKQP